MKGKRHTPDQNIGQLRKADAMLGTGATIGQVCQKLAVSEHVMEYCVPVPSW
jgi:hypothetical protein